MRMLLGALFLTVALLLPGSVDGRQDKPRVKVGFVTNNAAEYWILVEKGAADAAKEQGVDLLFRRPVNPTAADQKEIIEDLRAKGIQALALSPLDPEGQKDYLEKVATQMPLATLESDAVMDKRRCHIAYDNRKAGRAAGKLVKEALPDGGVLAFFVGLKEPLSVGQRIQGILDELGFEGAESKDGKYRLARKEPYTDEVNLPKARANASMALAALKDEPKLCLIGLWAYNAPAILSSVKQAGKEGKVKIVGFDEDTETLKGIEAGLIYGTVVQNPQEIGRQTVQLLAALARKEKVDLAKNGVVFIPEHIVTKDGGPGRLKAADFRKELDRLLGR